MKINNDILDRVDKKIEDKIRQLDELEYINSKKIIETFHEFQLSYSDFNETTGYGYNDIGRDKIDEIFAKILDAEKAIARPQILSGTHALTIGHFAILRPGDTMLAISGLPYDSLQPVIGIRENKSSLKEYGIKYEQIDLLDNSIFNLDAIEGRIKEGKAGSKDKIKVITIQKSKGYSIRKSIDNEKIAEVTNLIKTLDKDIIIFVDNCYTELVEDSPLNYGVDLIAGSLIKNLGGGIAPVGGYLAGRSDLVELCAERLTVPGQGFEVGPSLGINKHLLQGLYLAPSVVTAALKTAVFTACIFEELGFDVEPKYNGKRVDIVQSIIFRDPELLQRYCMLIQAESAVDAHYAPIADDMPGYDDKIIMASGSFVSGSSIELSCDGPIRDPFVAFQQGSMTYAYGRRAVINAINNLF